MKKLLLISVLLGTLVFGQKNNHSTQASTTVQQIGTKTSAVSATVPRRLSYQGLLTKANGRAVKDGSYPVTFRLWTKLEDGTMFWEEEQTLDIDDGIISATLGTTIPIETIPADAYLEIEINGTTLSPRQELTSVFYAVISDTAKFAQGGLYTDLDNLPDLTIYAPKDTLANYVITTSLDSVALTGDYNDLENLPDLSTVSVTGDYNDLDNLPDLSGLTQSDTLNYYVMSDSLSQYTLTDNLAVVALSNDYNDLDNIPDLDQYATMDTLGTYVFSDTLANYVLTDSLGTLAEQNADNVDIIGGTIVDITDLAIADGGTGASDNSSARANLGIEIGVDVQAYDADLADLADGSLSADKVEYLENVTSDVQEQIDAIGDGPVNSLEDLGVTADSTELNYVDGVTSNIQDQLDGKQDINEDLTAISGLSHGDGNIIVSDGSTWTVESGVDARTSLGLGSIATQEADNVAITGGYITGINDLAIADGGTAASDITTARINLGLEIGVDVQGYDADLTDLADGTLSADKVEYLENVTSDVQAQLDAKATLGEFGSIATQDADNVSITGGSITDITDITIADGGTGASDVASARSNLGLEIGVDVQGYDADLADLADGKLSASKVEYGQYFISTDGTSGQIWTSDGDGPGVWGDLTGITGAASTIDTEDLTASRAVVSDGDGKIAVSDVTSTELGYMAGVTSNVQTQLDNKQNKDDHLSDIADLSHSDGNFIVSNGTKWTIENGADARTSMGLGSIATQEADNVSITGGSITGITDLAIADGGTNASDVATARSNLGLEIGVDVQAYDADLADLADGELSASKVQYGIRSEGISGQVWTSDGDGPGDWSTPSSATVKITDNESTDESNALIFAADADLDGGTLGLESDGDATYNPSTGVITATGFNGATVVVSTSVDVTGSAGLILENDETITNSTDGTVVINGTVAGGTGSAAGVFQSSGDQDLTLKTGNSTTGTITITDGTDGDIAITPNGDGKVQLDGLAWPTADGSANQMLKTDGSGTLSWASASSLTSINTLSDALIEDTGSMYVGNDPSSTTDEANYNLAVGTTALDAITTGDKNTAVGYDVLSDNTTGEQNSALGFRALKSTTNGSYNTAVGFEALYVNTNHGNSAFGWRSLRANTSGTYNTASGFQSLVSNTEGDNNTAIGYRALYTNTLADNNTAMGFESLHDANRTADTDGYNTALGYQAGNTGTNDITTGNKNTLLGSSTAASDEAGTNQSVIGYGASGQADNSVTLGNADVTAIYMSQDKGATVYAAALGFGSTAMTLPTADGSANQMLKTDGSGTLSWASASSLTSINTLSDALVEDTGSMYVGNDPSSTTDGADYNVGVGTTALDATTTGHSNTALGYDALTDNISGNRNTAIGTFALKDNTTGIVNVAVGSSSLDKNTDGNSNTAVGHSSAYSLASGSSNVSMGWKSAFTVETGNNNVIIGSEANPSTDGGSTNQIVIGQGTTGKGDNMVTMGNGDITNWTASDNNEVDLGSSSVQFKDLYVDGVAYTDAIGFGDVAMTLPTADGSVNQMLKTDGSGTLSWASASSLTSINTLSDALIEDTGSMYIGNDPSSTTDEADYNLAVGTTALDAITTGDNNVAVGYDALTVNNTGQQNVAVGFNALATNNAGSYNTATGYKALEANTSSTFNTAMGFQSMLSTATGGSYNTSVGARSLETNTTGDDNTAVGVNSLFKNSTGNNNTAVGRNSLYNATGDGNVAAGYYAGDLITSGTNNTIIGNAADPSANSGTNQTVIGYDASGQANNSVVLGNADVTAVYMAQDKGATVYAAGISLENDETITNATDGTIVIDGKADFNDNAITGYGADLQTESGTSKTLAAADNGTIIVCSSSSAVTITVPASLPSGFNCMIIQNGSGQVSLSASSTTLNNRNGSKTAGQYAILTLVHLGSNVFVVSGDTSS